MTYDQQAEQAFNQRHMPVAEANMDVRMRFLKKVYGLMFSAILVMAVVAALSTYFSINNFQAAMNYWFVGIIIYLIASFAISRMLRDPLKGHIGLYLFAVIEGLIFGPFLALAYYATGGWQIVAQALILTVLVFGGLTAYVFITKEDFSFLKGFLSIMSFFALGVVILVLIFGGISLASPLAIVIPAVFILLLSLYVLYDTSIIMKKLPEEYAAAGAAMLFVDFAGLLWNILFLLLALTGDR